MEVGFFGCQLGGTAQLCVHVLACGTECLDVELCDIDDTFYHGEWCFFGKPWADTVRTEVPLVVFGLIFAVLD